MSKRNIIGEDNICPLTKELCLDECCPPGAICNLSGNLGQDDCKPESLQSPPAGVEQRAKEYALKWIPELETDDYWDRKQKTKQRLEIEEHYENGFIAGSESQGQQAVIQILPDDEKNWFPMECQDCGWIGSSGNCAGGGQIADTGDYDDPLCPCCLSKKVDEVDNKQPLSSYVDRLTKAGETIKKLTEQYGELYWKTIPPPHTA